MASIRARGWSRDRMTTSAGARGSADLPRKAVGDLHPLLDGGEQQHAASMRQPRAIKAALSFLRATAGSENGKKVIVIDGGRGAR